MVQSLTVCIRESSLIFLHMSLNASAWKNKDHKQHVSQIAGLSIVSVSVYISCY